MSTIQQIADTMGVHPTTVSRILKNDVEYKRPAYVKRAKKIRDLAQRLGYRPNSAARAVATQRFGTIALVLHACRQRSYLPQKLLDGILAALEESDLRLNVSRSSDEEMDDPTYVPRILREWNADGLLVDVNTQANERLIGLLREYRMPSVWLNIKMDADCVYPDDYGAGRMLTERLINEGFKQIGYLGLGRHPGEDHYSKIDRPRGYRDVMMAAGLKPMCYPDGKHDSWSDMEAQLADGIARSVRDGSRAAWIGYSELETNQIMTTATGELGLRINKDFVVATFSDMANQNRLYHIEAVSPMQSVGRRSVELLNNKIESPETVLPPLALPWTLSIPGS